MEEEANRYRTVFGQFPIGRMALGTFCYEALDSDTFTIGKND